MPRQPYLLRRATVVAALCAGSALTTQAAVMTAQFSPVGGQWEVALDITNDGTPALIANFSLIFDGPNFSNLSVVSSPVGWDSIVVQADPGLASPGFFDSLASATEVLDLGESQGSFVVGFGFAGIGAPGSLRYQILDENFDVLFEGQTVPVPEPAAWLLCLAGLGLVSQRAVKSSKGVR